MPWDPDNLARDEDGQPIIRGYNVRRRRDRTIHEALGMVKGILADKSVHPLEVVALGRWLLANEEFAGEWPLNVLTERVSRALDDDRVTEEECVELGDILVRLVGSWPPPIDENPSTRLPLTDPPPVVQFSGHEFVFTGKFYYGSRDACEAAVIERGGACCRNISKRTNMVVIGELASRDWIHSSFGRKIQAAVERKIPIVAEDHWCTFL